MNADKMQTAVISGAGLVELVERDIPVPGPGEALLKVRYSGICGSDIHAYQTGFFPPGMVFGHEYVGEIAGWGEGVSGFAVGETVSGNNLVPCNNCHYCHSGRQNICPQMQRIGVFQDGAMAGFLKVPAQSLSKYSASRLITAALAEPLSVAFHGVRIAGVENSDSRSAVILGAGTIGLCVLAILKEKGLGNIIVLEKDEHRSSLALKMGATAVYNPGAKDTPSKVTRVLEENKEGIIFECAGNPAAIESAFDMVGQGGTIVIMSICEKPVELNFLRLVTGEIRILTSCGKTPEDFNSTLALLEQGKVDLSPLIKTIKGLESVPATLESLSNGTEKAVKVVVEINHGDSSRG